jgi:hypothetical protein
MHASVRMASLMEDSGAVWVEETTAATRAESRRDFPVRLREDVIIDPAEVSGMFAGILFYLL